ncbi:MAG: acyltransferase [Alphaproteobacteria bacterium]|nr:acyltransferase [Alphaproteobacteria bacterium]
MTLRDPLRAPPPTGGPLLSIQILRGLAALAVVIAHLRREFELKLHIADPLAAFSGCDGAGVDVFFVISGFIMVYVSESLFAQPGAAWHFYVRRCLRIIPLYWTVSAVFLVFVLTHYETLGAANLSLPAVVASFFFVPWPLPDGTMAPLYGVGWTLNYEMFFYLVFALAVGLPRRLAVGAIGVAFAVLVALGQRGKPLPHPLDYWTDPIILEFAFGVGVAAALRAGIRLPFWGSLGLVLAGAMMVLAIDPLPELRWLRFGVPAALLVAACVLTRAPRLAAWPWLAMGFLGDASYALYLTHPIALALPRRLFPGLVDPQTQPWLFAGLLIATTVATAVATHVLFEKPLTRFLQNLAARRRLAAPAASVRLAAAKR